MDPLLCVYLRSRMDTSSQHFSEDDDASLSPMSDSTMSDGGALEGHGEILFTDADLEARGEPANVVTETIKYATKDAATAACKRDGTLRSDGSWVCKKTGVKTFYLKCGNLVRVPKGGTVTPGQEGCQASYHIRQNGAEFTVEVKHRHSDDCSHRNVSHGVGTEMRTRILEGYKTPYEAQTARVADLPDLKKLSKLFEYNALRDSKFSSMSEEDIRAALIAQAKAKRPAEEHEFLDTLVVRVREWKVDRVGRRRGKTFTIPCTERVIVITTPQLAQQFTSYKIGGIDGTYGLATKHAVILNMGVYHERSFIPLLVAISSSVHTKVMDEETPIPKGESQRHYETLLSILKELNADWQPETFIRDGAPQVHNAVENAYPGVEQVLFSLQAGL